MEIKVMIITKNFYYYKFSNIFLKYVILNVSNDSYIVLYSIIIIIIKKYDYY